MRLPFFDHIRCVIVGNAPHKYPLATVSFTAQDPEPFALPELSKEYSATAVLEFRKVAPKGAEQYVREEAAHAFTYMIYKGAVEQVLEARQHLRTGNLEAAEETLRKLIESMTA